MPSSDTTVSSTSNAMSHISAYVLSSYHGPVDKCETHSLNVCQSECTQGIHMQFKTYYCYYFCETSNHLQQ